MLRFIYGAELSRYPKLRASMHRDRAHQFRDRLGWQVDVNAAGEEWDQYDGEDTLYVIWQNPDGRHGGSMRLRPTMGSTMVNEHFLHLMNGKPVRSERIWECTRFCLSKDATARVAAALMLGGGEIMQRFGVDHYIGVFDAPMKRIYQRIGSPPVILGSAGTGRHQTSVGLWDFTEAARRAVAHRAAISAPLMRLWFDRSLGVPHAVPMSA